MKLVFRKNIIGGFRIILSKSDTGCSYSVKRLQYTKKAEDEDKITFNEDGSICNSEAVESSSDEFISAMNEANKKNRLYKILRIIAVIGIVIGLCSAISYNSDALSLNSIPFIILFAVCLTIFMLVPQAIVILETDFQDESLKLAYTEVDRGINMLKSCVGLWEIASQRSIDDWKNNAGAGKVVDRKQAKITSNHMSFIESRLGLQSINAQGMNVVFLPNFLAICQNDTWKAIEYSQVKIEHFESVFIESGAIPEDTEIIGHTYLHPNKSGGPDKRYSNNPQMSQCAYAEIFLTSERGLALRLMGSNREKAKTFFTNVNKYIELFTS